MSARSAHSRAPTTVGDGRASSSNTPLQQDSLPRDTPGARQIDQADVVMDCSTWTAQERIARKREGHETNPTDTGHDTGGMAALHARYPRHNIWATGHWTHSTGRTRRVYVPEEQRNTKRYGQKNRKLELITYNAMYAGNWMRMQDISQTFPRGVVGIQGAKQRRDPEASAYKTRKTGRHVVFDFPHPHTHNRKGGPLAGVAILLPHAMATGISMIKHPTEKRLQGRGGLIRVKLPDGRDYAFITIYARVEEPGDKADEVNNALWEWVENELRELPTRSTPVIFTDAN